MSWLRVSASPKTPKYDKALEEIAAAAEETWRKLQGLPTRKPELAQEPEPVIEQAKQVGRRVEVVRSMLTNHRHHWRHP